jgi:hypothetical protein
MGIIIVAFVVRLYKIESPIADWHSWRQADTAAVARNYIKFGVDLLRPRYDDLSSIPSGKPNPMGYRMVEFPLYQLVSYSFYKIYPAFTIEIWLRLVSILSSLGSIIFLSLLIKKYIDEKTALLAALIYSILPYSIYYSRTILPETPAILCAFIGIFCVDKALELAETQKGKFIGILTIAAVFSAVSLLIKPTVVFLLLPIPYLFLNKYGLKSFVRPAIFIFTVISVVPFILWRLWIQKYPEGIPAFDWLLNGGNIRFTGAFFRWLLAERMGKLILGYGGFVLFWIGVAARPLRKEGWLFLSLLLGIFLYFIVFARGNVQHDYYQIIFIPIASIFVAKGLSLLLTPNQAFSRWLSVILGVSLFLMMEAFSWYEVKTYYWINNPEIIEAGKIVDKLTPPDAKIIAPYNGDTAFLYQTNRQGWPVTEKSFPEMIEMGASYFVAVKPDKDVKHLATEYGAIVQNDKYILLDLKQKP